MKRDNGVKEYFDILAKTDKWACLYDKASRHSYNYLTRRKTVEMLLSNEKYSRVLDIGCGTGDYLMSFMNEDIEYVGIDYADNMIAKAQERFKTMAIKPHFSFQVASALDLAFKDNSFDLVLAIGFIEYFKSPQQVLQNICRLIKPGGILICQSINRSWIPRYWYHRQIQTIKQAAINLFKYLHAENVSGAKNPQHMLYSKSQLDKLLLQFSFKNIDYAYANYNIVPFLDIISPRLHAWTSEKISKKSQKSFACFASNYIGKYKLMDFRKSKI